MRVRYPLIAAAAFAQTGCSALVAASGKDLSQLTARAQVHDTFGPPATVADTAEGGTVEEFFTRRKIAEAEKGIYIVMLDTPTLGAAELYLFPHEVFVAARRSVLGQLLRVEYDGTGRVVGIRHDEKPVYGTWLIDKASAARGAGATPPPPYLPGTAAQCTTTGPARFRQPPSGTSPCPPPLAPGASPHSGSLPRSSY